MIRYNEANHSYLVSALINHEEAGDYFASLGVSINDIDVFTEDILWGNS